MSEMLSFAILDELKETALGITGAGTKYISAEVYPARVQLNCETADGIQFSLTFQQKQKEKVMPYDD